ncbi:TetR/AcrR family transcriptional regulator [Actinoplanes philippinensis]|uniref:TetR/AcrR family transcriptional regulator n=1 Tax=Actinoplanes philippinensis TaxID=35752 RepID=UPI000A70D153|nr:TetR family transcriptional regulator [Actinoplanes philippinensis]
MKTRNTIAIGPSQRGPLREPGRGRRPVYCSRACQVREVAAEAGVSPRVVQYHFAGKQDLLVTALRELHRDNGIRARERIAAAGPRPGIDPAREADLLVSGVTGLGLDLLHHCRSVVEVHRTLDYHLDRILRT